MTSERSLARGNRGKVAPQALTIQANCAAFPDLYPISVLFGRLRSLVKSGVLSTNSGIASNAVTAYLLQQMNTLYGEWVSCHRILPELARMRIYVAIAEGIWRPEVENWK
jgi:hypothetical protein